MNNYEGENTRGLSAYWGYLFGALDRRNFAMLHHAPLEDSVRSADSKEENASKSSLSDESADNLNQSSIFTYLSELTNRTDSQQMPPNSMPNDQQKSFSSPENGQQMSPNSMPIVKLVRVSVIVPSLVQPPYDPAPVLQPADEIMPADWADDVGKFL